MPDKQTILGHFAGNFGPFYDRYLPDRKRGKANCPFHDCDSKSLSVDTETGLFKCHFPGCAASGDIFTFYQRKHGINGDFPAALRGIAIDFGISGNGAISERPETSANPGKPVNTCPAEKKASGRVEKTYDYTDAEGKLLFQVCRMEPKDFRQRRPDGKGGWIWKMEGVERVLYRLPEVVKADEVWIVEGEKDADNLAELGFTATTNAGGAGKWVDSYSEALAGKRIFILPDNDDPGRKHAHQVAKALHGKAASIEIIELPGLPPKGDVSDFIAGIGDPGTAAERLAIMAGEAAEYEPPTQEEAEQTAIENPWTRAVIDFETLRQIELPERRAFLFPWLTEQSMALVYSWRGTGKSFFTLGIINAVTKGEKFGPWEAVEPVPCLYLDAEMPARMLQERAEEMGIGRDTKAPARLISMNYALDMGLPRRNLLDAEWRGQLSEILITGGYKLFFVDNISSLTPEIEENAKQAWDVINQWILELRFRGVSTVSLHHAGKSGAQRGTSGREDNVDTSILLKRPTDYQVTDGCRFVCAFEKDRCTDGRQLLVDYEFQYRDGLWTVANAKTKGRDQVLKLLDKGKSQKEVAEELQLTKGRVSQIRREAINHRLLTEENKLTQSGFNALFGTKPD
jgi:hypothetical protein